MIPRFRGNSLKDEKGWYWEMFVSMLGYDDETQMFSTHSRFKTKDEALKDLVKEIQNYVKYLAKTMPELNINPDHLYDMKTNQLFSVDNKDKH